MNSVLLFIWWNAVEITQQLLQKLKEVNKRKHTSLCTLIIEERLYIYLTLQSKSNINM